MVTSKTTTTGSFSQDPIGFDAGDANLYRYVGNHPTNATDPSGLQEPGTLPTLEEVERIRRELGRNRAMGGISLGAQGNGIPAGSFRPSPIHVPFSSGSSSKTEYSYNQWWSKFGPSHSTDHTKVKSVGCLGVFRAYAGKLVIWDSPTRMFYVEDDPAKSLEAAVEAAKAASQSAMHLSDNFELNSQPRNCRMY